MSPTFFPRELVARRLSVAPTLLLRYERRGLVRVVQHGADEGYGPDEVRRLWTIVSLQRDLGVNLAGVEAILKLRAHLDEVHRRLGHLARDLSELLEVDLEAGDAS